MEIKTKTLRRRKPRHMLPDKPMFREALQALDDSIKKWEYNVTAESRSDMKLGAAHCPLCLIYNIYPVYSTNEETRHNAVRLNCFGCPVRRATNGKYCKNTPYYDVQYAGDEEAAFDAARRMLQFLKAIRPIGVEYSDLHLFPVRDIVSK